MTATTAKPLAARALEATGRAATLRVRVEQVVAERHYLSRSQSQPGVTYRIDRTSDGWTCECEGYRYTGCCKHLGAVVRRAAREGWRFGKIARQPEPTPARDELVATAMAIFMTGRQ